MEELEKAVQQMILDGDDENTINSFIKSYDLGKTQPTTQKGAEPVDVMQAPELTVTESPSVDTSLELPEQPQTGTIGATDVITTPQLELPDTELDLPSALNFTKNSVARFSSFLPKTMGGLIDLTETLYETSVVGATIDKLRGKDVTEDKINTDNWYKKAEALSLFGSEKDEEGNVLSSIDLYEKGEYEKASEQFSLELAGALPSLILTYALPGTGSLIIGGATFGEEFEKNVKERPDESAEKMLANAAIKGGSDAIGEYFGAKAFKLVSKAPSKLKKEIIEKITGDWTPALLKKMGLSAVSEGVSEGGASALSLYADELVFDDEISSSQYWKTAIHSAALGAVLGTGASAVSTGVQYSNRKKTALSIIAPKAWRQEQFNISKEIDRLKSAEEKAPDRDKEYFRKKIKDLSDLQNKRQEDLKNEWESKSREEQIEYAKNLDEADRLSSIVYNAKYSKKIREDAKKDQDALYDAMGGLIGGVETKQETQQQFLEALAETEGGREDDIKFAEIVSNAFGKEFNKDNILENSEAVKKKFNNGVDANAAGFVVDGNIYINREAARKSLTTRDASHEVLHGVLETLFKGEDSSKLINEFKQKLTPEQNKIVERRIKDLDYSDTYMQENPDEYITQFYNAVIDGEIEYKQNVLSKVSDFFKNTFRTIGFSNIELKTGEDLYDFVKDYSKARQKVGKLNKATVKKIKSLGGLTYDEFKASKGLEIQKIYDEKGVEGAMEIIEAYKPLTTKITNKYRDVPGFDFELLQSEIEIGQRGLLDLIQDYTPDRGATLNTYVQGQLERRAIEAANRILDTEFTLDVTEAKGVTDTTTEEITERAAEKPKEKIDNKLMSKLNISEDIKNKVVDAIVKTLGTKLPSLKSGKLKAELTKSFRIELKPVIAKMIGTRAAYDAFMVDNFKLIYNALPQSTINRRFNEFAEPVLDKDGKQLREKTAVGKGVFKKKDIVKAEWLKYFIDQPGNVKGTRKTAIAEEIGVELAFDATTEVLKNPKVLEKFKATQEILGNVVSDNIAEDLAKQIDRSNVKYSKVLDLTLDLQKSISDGLQTKEFKSLLAGRAGLKNAIKESVKLYFTNRIEKLDDKTVAEIASDLNKANVILDFKTVANEKSAIEAAELLSKQLIEEIKLPTEYVSVEKSENKILDEDIFTLNVLNEARIATKYLVDKLGDAANAFLDGTHAAGRLAGIYDVVKTPSGIIIEEGNFKKSGSKTKRYSIFRDIADAVQALGRKPKAILKDIRTKNFFTNPKSKFNKLSGKEKIEYIKSLAEEGVGLKKSFLTGLKELRKGYKSGVITQSGGKMFLLTQFGNMQGLGKAMAAPRMIIMKPNGEIMSFKEMEKNGLAYKNDVGVLEHMIPAKKMATLSYKYFLSGDPKVLKEIESLLEEYNTMIIPKKMDDFIKNRGLQEKIGIAKDRYAGTGVIIMDVLTGEKTNTGVIPEKSNVKYSKNLDTEFNQLLQATTGVEYYKTFSPAKARLVGRGKGKRKFFIPYSADDFVGLLYATLGEGKVGDKQMAWYEENLLRPFSRGIQQYEVAKQKAMREWMTLSSQIKKDVPGGLNKRNDTGFRNQDSLRMYIWAKQGMDVPGAAKSDVSDAVALVSNNPKLKEFAERLIALNPEGYPAPGQSWDAGDITTDIVSYVNDVRRGEFLTEWKQNVDQIFTDKNKQKLLASYGQNYIDALEDILHRMKTGRNRKFGTTKAERTFMDWTNNSVGAIMFFNARSAVLQTLSAVNFINFSDNNPINAGLAFANQPQYWKDFSTLFNSDFLKQRRSGLQTDVNADEIANAAKSSSNKAKAALSAILKLGFTPTQVADSFAIASGGATFYRNRVKKYIKEGLDKEAAEKKAFTDFQEVAEETQQSARPDRISSQQASSLGRLVLAFGNTPMQYARLTKKASLDLINGRGDWKTNISKIAYYSVIQNIIFSSLQQGLFALLFDEEDDEKEKSRYFRIGNSSIDTLLRGAGVYGAAAATVKNMVLEIIEQSKKSRPDYTKVAMEATALSPPINSKLRKLESAGKTFTYKQSKEKVFTEGFSFENPGFLAAGKTISALTNLPADRVVQKADHIHTAMQDETELWQAIALSLGWSEWDLNMIEKNSSSKTLTIEQMRKLMKRNNSGVKKLMKRN